MKIYIQKFFYLVGIKICYKQGRSQVFIGGGKLWEMINLSIKHYRKILTRKLLYCKIFNFLKNCQICFKINIIIILKGFALLKSS